MNLSTIRLELLSTYPGYAVHKYENQSFTNCYVHLTTARKDTSPLLIKKIP
jgi:hypothetical protein